MMFWGAVAVYVILGSIGVVLLRVGCVRLGWAWSGAIDLAACAVAASLVLACSSPKWKWDSQGVSALIIGGLFGGVAFAAACWLMEREQAGKIWPLLSALSPVVVLLIDYLFFKGSISTTRIVGVAACVVGVYLIFRS